MRGSVQRSKGYKKPTWRRINFEFLQKQPHLWDKKGKLQFRYAELSGATGDRMFWDHLEDKVPDKTFYTAIDHDIVCLVPIMRTQAKLPFRLSYGDFQVALQDIVQEKPTLGVIGLDTTNGTRQNWWADQYLWLREIVGSMVRNGCRKPCLILNHDLDRGVETATVAYERLLSHAKSIAVTFREWDSERTLQRTLIERLEVVQEPGFCDRFAGGFHVYRSESDGALHNRMVTVRLVFDGRYKSTTVFRG